MKKIYRMFLFGVLVFIVSKVFIAFTVYQALSGIKEQYKNDFLLTYKWISSSIDGSLSIEGVELTPYDMKKTFTIDEITFQYFDYLSLATNLSSLKNGSVTELKSISVPRIQAELKGKSFKESLLSDIEPAWFSPFSLYGCDEIKQLSAEQYQKMGITQWQSSLSINFSENDQGNDVLFVSLDQNELGRVNVTTEWPKWTIETFLKQRSLDSLAFINLKVEHQDAGFFRRLNILCNKKSVDNRSFFSAKSALAWKNAMYSQGLIVNDTLVELYGTYLMQGGSLVVEAKKDDGFELANFMELMNKDAVKFFDVVIKLNDNVVPSAELYVDSSIIFPPAVEDEVKELPISVEDIFQPGYKPVEIELIEQYVSRKIQVVMVDGKEYSGVLSSVTEYNLDLTQNLPGGVVNYPLMLNEIQVIEVWMNQAP